MNEQTPFADRVKAMLLELTPILNRYTPAVVMEGLAFMLGCGHLQHLNFTLKGKTADEAIEHEKQQLGTLADNLQRNLSQAWGRKVTVKIEAVIDAPRQVN